VMRYKAEILSVIYQRNAKHRQAQLPLLHVRAEYEAEIIADREDDFRTGGADGRNRAEPDPQVGRALAAPAQDQSVAERYGDTRVAPRASRASNSHRSARSKSLQRSSGSAVRSATSRNSTAFPRLFLLKNVFGVGIGRRMMILAEACSWVGGL
jgi:hypothetical protein